jgi:hypothetical protein
MDTCTPSDLIGILIFHPCLWLMAAKKGNNILAGFYSSHIQSPFCLILWRVVLITSKRVITSAHACIKESDYISPINCWMEEACSSTDQPWIDFGFLFHDHDPPSVFGQGVMEIPTCVHAMVDVSLFWFITKHKGKFHDVDKIIKWLNWLYDFT